MNRIVVGALCLIIAGCASPKQPVSYDQTRYNRIGAILKQDLRGIPFEEFESRLGIKGAPWDRSYTNEPQHSRRIYHLGGFSLDVSIEHKNAGLFTDSHFYTGLHADGLDRKQRMARHAEALGEYFSQRARRLEETRRKARQKNQSIQRAAQPEK